MYYQLAPTPDPEEPVYELNYPRLRLMYNAIVEYDDKTFLESLPQALHLACMICFLKKVPSEICLADNGIIHELTHLLHRGTETPLVEIRHLFKTQLKLT